MKGKFVDIQGENYKGSLIFGQLARLVSRDECNIERYAVGHPLEKIAEFRSQVGDADFQILVTLTQTTTSNGESSTPTTKSESSAPTSKLKTTAPTSK